MFHFRRAGFFSSPLNNKILVLVELGPSAAPETPGFGLNLNLTYFFFFLESVDLFPVSLGGGARRPFPRRAGARSHPDEDKKKKFILRLRLRPELSDLSVSSASPHSGS